MPKYKKPIVDALKDKTYKRSSVSDEISKSICKTYDDLMDLNDHITSLVIENCALDALLHNLRVMVESSDIRTTHSGSFSLATRVITIIDLGDLNDYSSVIIHEAVHAASGLAFRFDTLRFEITYKIPTQESSLINYLNTPPLPCTVGEQMHRPIDFFKYEPDCVSQFKYNNPTINPAILKFKQCVREDYAHFKQHKYQCGNIGAKRLDNYFEVLEGLFPQGILETDPLCEVLSIYMECRVELFKLVKDKKITKEQALKSLEEKLPRIHAYVETDFKKVMQLRLESYCTELYYEGYDIQCVKSHMKPIKSNEYMGTLFKRDGSLFVSRAAHRNKASYEYLTKDTKLQFIFN